MHPGCERAATARETEEARRGTGRPPFYSMRSRACTCAVAQMRVRSTRAGNECMCGPGGSSCHLPWQKPTNLPPGFHRGPARPPLPRIQGSALCAVPGLDLVQQALQPRLVIRLPTMPEDEVRHMAHAHPTSNRRPQAPLSAPAYHGCFLLRGGDAMAVRLIRMETFAPSKRRPPAQPSLRMQRRASLPLPRHHPAPRPAWHLCRSSRAASRGDPVMLSQRRKAFIRSGDTRTWVCKGEALSPACLTRGRAKPSARTPNPTGRLCQSAALEKASLGAPFRPKHTSSTLKPKRSTSACLSVASCMSTSLSTRCTLAATEKKGREGSGGGEKGEPASGE